MRSVMSFSVICVWLFLAAVSAPTSVWGAPIVDTSGDPLRQDVPYFIVPANPISGGGVIPLTLSNNVLLCPHDVGQADKPSDKGSRVYFSSSSGLGTTDRMRIEFGPGEWKCNMSKIWRVGISPQLRRSIVSTGGATDQPDSQFGIHVQGDAYKIVHFSDVSSDEFKDVGVFTDNFNVKRLGLGPTIEQLRVRFERSVIPKTNHYEKTMLKTFPFYY